MGNGESTPVDESVPPRTLESRSVRGLADYINGGKCKKIVIMSGAGISTSAGIPDFRSPETGLYANLARLNLPHAEAVFDISFFRQNPLPFYTLAQELYPGKYRPTITHSFIKLLHEKSLLLKHFTQNIDCLDREAGVPGSHIVEAHGSFANQSCIECKASYPEDLMQKAVREKKPPHCKTCNGLVKPEIVFFGEQLPASFFEARHVPSEADLCIIIGTSLTVSPFAGLPQLVSEGVPRVLMNKERVGDIGSRPDDVLLLGDCDAQVRKLAEACGWLHDLEKLWISVGGTPAAKEEEKAEPGKSLSDEVDALTKEIDQTLSISDKHAKDTKGELAEKVESHLSGQTQDNGSEGPSASAQESKGPEETNEQGPTPSKETKETKETDKTKVNGLGQGDSHGPQPGYRSNLS